MGEFHPKYRELKISIGDLVDISIKKKKLGTKHEVISLERFVLFWKKSSDLEYTCKLHIRRTE